MYDQPDLSPAGQQRRKRILRLAQAQARRQRRRRKAVPAALIGTLSLILAALWATHSPDAPRPAVVILPTTVPTPPPTVTEIHVKPSPHRTHEIAITLIHTETGLADRLAIQPQPGASMHRLSDDELIQQLADAGQPAGLAWIDGRERLVFLGRHNAVRHMDLQTP